ncbi:TetR family transcriptional regulator [Arthrobacter sp. 35W]|uniref:TetR family transcriptional regulator n=1 Tax=Arthrobacter sp. 35W TaxID=1132441 RepID=UPI00047A7D4B|nr:TetR family transcriptional regulator [Arthrobacter sp. 35W]
MTTQLSARERVLLAFEDLLISDGERAATLDAVAAAAGVSKGGLLYHFKSREALTAGLVAKMREQAETDFAQMRIAPEGGAHYYVKTSVVGDSTFDRTLIAAMRLAQGEDHTVRAAFEELHTTWLELLLADVGDPAIARAIMLIGDGLYYNAALFGIPPSNEAQGEMQALLDVVAELKSRGRS